MIRKILFIISLLISSAFSLTAEDTSTQVFNERIKSLQVRLDGNDFARPVMVLNSPDRILISFDHLDTDHTYLRYELVHCNADWQPSGLVDSEFLDGFNVGNIDDYDFSRATTVHYVHYSLSIPNADMAPTLSGNYLVKIYPEDNPDDIWLQCRFQVSEQSALIGGEVTSRTDVDYNREHQQLSLVIDTKRSDVRDRFNDVIVTIDQNGRTDNVATLRQPLRVSDSKSYYEHLPALIFPAGNEYRRFETVSTRYPGMNIEDIGYKAPYYHMTLATDASRARDPYLYDQTQHGRFFVREYNSSDSDTEADYVVVHFSLDYPDTPGYDIFLDGDFTNRRFDPESLMTFNRATGLYERSMLLKQGAYNYQYLAVPVGASTAQTAPIEGNKYQTVNEYNVCVYVRTPGARYDRLVGTYTLFSGK